jgi:hypothetical protein
MPNPPTSRPRTTSKKVGMSVPGRGGGENGGGCGGGGHYAYS